MAGLAALRKSSPVDDAEIVASFADDEEIAATSRPAPQAASEAAPAAAVEAETAALATAAARSEPIAGLAGGEQPEQSSLDAELESIVADRDINTDAVAPNLRTEEEAEKSPALEASGAAIDTMDRADPVVPASANATPSPAAGPTAESAVAGDGAAASEDITKLDLDDETLKLIASLPADRRKAFVSDLFARHNAISLMEQQAGEIAKNPKRKSNGGKGLFPDPTRMFKNNPELRAAKKSIQEARDYLSPDNIRHRVLLLRKQEIINAANEASLTYRKMTLAAAKLNAALNDTAAGARANAEIATLLAKHPGMTRQQILQMSKDGTLAEKIGEPDPIKPLWDEAFKDAKVQAAWDELNQEAGKIADGSKQLTDRMKAFEEHFPDYADSEQMNETVNNAIGGIQEGLDKPQALNPEDMKKYAEQLKQAMNSMKEFISRLLSNLSFGPKP